MAKFSELRTSLERDAIGASYKLKLHGRGQLLTRKHARDMHVGNRAQLLDYKYGSRNGAWRLNKNLVEQV